LINCGTNDAVVQAAAISPMPVFTLTYSMGSVWLAASILSNED
jgi:hypothetical protein